MASACARFQQVEKCYGRFRALQGLSFEIYPGEVLAFLGPNGAGKSTSLQLLAGLRRPTSGRIELFGQDPQCFEVRERVGMTPQELDFPPFLKVGEVLRLISAAYRRGDPLLWRDRLHLNEIWGRRTQALSGGEKRRLGLACALLAEPQLLLLDEPTTGLDVESRHVLWQVIREERRRGTAICLTTHYLDEVEELSDRVLVIDRGQKYFEGSLSQIRSCVEIQRIEFRLAADQEERLHLPVFRDLWLNHEVREGVVTLWTRQSDQVLRALVEQRIDFQHLLVHAASLEEAFLQLRKKTGGHA